MKLKRVKEKKFKLFKLELINSKIYLKKQNRLNNFDSNVVKLESVELYFKRALQVIYYYHINNQKIFFIGFPKKNQKDFDKLLNKTNHLSIPETVWVNGIFSNQLSIFKHLKKHTKNSEAINSLKQIKANPDLIVLFESNIESIVLKEAKKLRIPVVLLSMNDHLQFNFLYKVTGNFSYLNNKFYNLFFLLLRSIFKK